MVDETESEGQMEAGQKVQANRRAGEEQELTKSIGIERRYYDESSPTKHAADHGVPAAGAIRAPGWQSLRA